MSTQSAQSILFTHTAPQQAFRLLELPPDLAELLASDNPPTLEIKSPTPTTDATDAPTDTSREYINLCTPTQTYRIRQVQSSNSLHILRPSDDGTQRGDLAVIGATQEDDQNVPDLNLSETMTAIAKCGSTLELHKPQEGFNINPILEGLLGTYDSGDDIAMSTGQGGMMVDSTDQRQIVEKLFADVPVSNMQCARAWKDICAFVLPATGRGWVPTARAKIAVWKRVVEGAVLQGIDLGTQFLVEDLWKSILDEDGEAEWPRELFEAVVRRVCETGDEGSLLEGETKWASIDKERCVRWVGETYLEAVAPTAGAAAGRSEFLNAWKDHLPEGWREEATFSKLTEDKHRFPDPTTVCFVSDEDRQKLKKNVSTDASASTAAKKTRNWHELFKNQKRQKR
ncbi:hypothetical protein ASPBRDRAFT_59310 [Aspergillus brasiliensis CBS 101740]|uniref:Sister chromatid cohesion protein Dcc1 n=1 Tax=Aspergillus brasiliensis (strain CBS 101740 / IMI 381727 / IBT 21946) TaxID=767769 RepID=A0A1L9U5D2_ASPBC|nr:hypothetical protein ASPBRDRAFT_59310 [Aspergillus brasiliensis CBS 101740]